MSTGIPVDFSQRSFVTPAMTANFGNAAQPDLQDLFRRTNESVEVEPAFKHYPAFRQRWDELPEEERRAILLSTGHEAEVGKLIQNDLGTTKPFEKMTPLESSRAMGLEPGSESELAWVDRVEKVRASKDKPFEDNLRVDFMRTANANFSNISDDILKAAKTGKSLGLLQNAATGYSSYAARLPRIAAETVVNTMVQDSAVGLAQLGVMGIGEYFRGVNYLAQTLLPESLRPGPNTAVQEWAAKTVATLDEVEPLIRPVAREGFLDDLTSGVTQGLGYIGIAALTGGAGVGAKAATSASAARTLLARGALATFGSAPVAGTMMLGMSSREAARNTKDIQDPTQRFFLTAASALAINAVERLQFGRNMRLFDSPWANFSGRLLTANALTNATEEGIQGYISVATGIMSDYLSGVSNDRDYLAPLYEAAVGGGTGLVLGAFGAGDAYRRYSANTRLLSLTNQMEAATVQFASSDDVPLDLQHRAYRQTLGELANVPVSVDAAGIVALGDDAVKNFAQMTGHRETVIRSAAREGLYLDTDFGNGMFASALTEKKYYQTLEGNDARIERAPVSLMARSEAGSGSDAANSGVGTAVPTASGTPLATAKNILPLLLDTETSRDAKAQALLGLRARNLGIPSGQNVAFGEMTQVDEILDLAEAANETARIQAAVEAGTATESERARWQVFSQGSTPATTRALFSHNFNYRGDGGTAGALSALQEILRNGPDMSRTYKGSPTQGLYTADESGALQRMTGAPFVLLTDDSSGFISNANQIRGVLINPTAVAEAPNLIEALSREFPGIIFAEFSQRDSTLSQIRERSQNAEGRIQESGRTTGENVGQEADTASPGSEGAQSRVQQAGSKKYLVNLSAKEQMFQRVKEFVTQGKRKTLHELFRAAPEGASVAELRLTAENLEDMTVEMEMAEQVSALDNVSAVRRFRESLTSATNGDTAYVSQAMQILKTLIVHQARAKGVSAETYASSFWVNAVLRSPSIRNLADNTARISQVAEDLQLKADGALVRRVKPSGAVIDNASVIDRLAARQDTADGYTTPDGQRVGFIWSRPGRMMSGILQRTGTAGVQSIPSIIDSGGVSETNRGRTRTYTTQTHRLTLRKWGETWVPTDLVEIAPASEMSMPPSDDVAAYMGRTVLQGESRSSLESLLRTVEARGQTLGDLGRYEQLVQRSQGVAAAIDGFAENLVAATNNLENIAPQLLELIGLELPAEQTPETLAGLLRERIEGLREIAHRLRNFFTEAQTFDLVEQMTTRDQIFTEGNRNVDGLAYADWLTAAQRGDYAPMAMQEQWANEGTELRPFSSFEDFSAPYDRARLRNNITVYLTSALSADGSKILRKPTAQRKQAFDSAISKIFRQYKIADYIAGFAEYAGFITNTDPRVFCDLHVSALPGVGRELLGQYDPSTRGIYIGEGNLGQAVIDFLTAQDDAARGTAVAGLVSTIAHEYHHQLLYTMIQNSYVRDSDVGPLYRDIVESNPNAGISPQSVAMFTDPTVDSPNKYLQYLSYPTEQLSYLAEMLFSNETFGGITQDLMNTLIEYEDIDTSIFSNETIQADLKKIQGLFVAVTQPELLDILASGTRFQRELGSISSLVPRVSTIFLDGGRYNYSTVPHEFFHLFIGLMKTDNPTLYRALLEQAGVPAGGSLSVDAEEKLARQFEVYLMGGKAPALHLRETFDQFSTWMSRIYDEKFRGDNSVNPELKRLFDKFFASEEQIRLAESMAGIEASYLKMLAEDNPRKKAVARTEKRVKLTARERERRLVVGTYMRISGEFESLRAQARQTVAQDPLNTFTDEAVAQGLLSKPKLHGWQNTDPLLPGQRGAFVEMVGEWNAANPDQIFNSPEDALDAMRRRGTTRDQVTAEFNRLKDFRYAQVIKDLGGLQENTDSAIFNDEMSNYLQKLHEAVQIEQNKKAGVGLQAAISRAVERQAAQEFSGFTVRDGKNYKKNVGVMRKALKSFASDIENGNVAGASLFLEKARKAEYKIQAAVELRERVNRVRTGWQRGLAKRLGNVSLQHRENIAAVLNTFGVNRRANTLSGQIPSRLDIPTPQQTGDLGSGVGELTADLSRMIPEYIQNLQAPEGMRTFEDLTVQQFNEVMDSLGMLEKAGTSDYWAARQLQYGDLPGIIDESITRMERLAARPGDYSASSDIADTAASWSEKASLLGVLNEFIFQRADGYGALHRGGGTGPMTDLFYAAQRAASEAEDLNEVYAEKMRPFFDEWKELMSDFRADDWGTIPEKIRLTHGAPRWTPNLLLMVGLNTGNQGTLDALKAGYQMTDTDIEAIMLRLGARGAKILQGMGDVMEELYEPQVRVFERIAGRTPPRIAPLAVDYGAFKVRGWYLPLATEKGTPSGSQFLTNLFPAIGRDPSQMHERTGTLRPPVLDASVVYNHIYSATRLIAAGDTMDLVKRVVFDERWARTFRSRFGDARYNDVLRHFDMIANPHIIYSQNRSVGAPVLDWLRQSAVTAGLGLRFVSGLKQWTDIVPVASVMTQQNRASLRQNLRALASSIRSLGVRGVLGMYDMPTTAEDGSIRLNGKPVDINQLSPMQLVYAKSAIMRTRDRRADMSLSHIARTALGDRRTVKLFGRDIGMSDVKDMFFTFVRHFDRGIASASWIAQYDLSKKGLGTFRIDPGMRDTEIERRAIQDADTLAKTMSSGAIADQTAAQRETGMRLFTTFMSAQTRRGSRMATTVDAWRRGEIGAKQLGSNLAVEIYGRLITGSLALATINYLRNVIVGAPEDEPDEDWWDYAGTILSEPLVGTLEVIPFGSGVASFARGYTGNVMETPSQRTLTTAVSDTKKAAKAWKEGDFGKALLYTAYGAGYVAQVPVRSVVQQVEDAVEFVSPEESRNGR